MEHWEKKVNVKQWKRRNQISSAFNLKEEKIVTATSSAQSNCWWNKKRYDDLSTIISSDYRAFKIFRKEFHMCVMI
jgi:hypothetical protein